ncbi:MAG TPA: hypothetical protein VFR55_00800, partial [Dehalococcoidia bacterium]|nr:hypothetical protein [Dehalococcoidia bacterium]
MLPRSWIRSWINCRALFFIPVVLTLLVAIACGSAVPAAPAEPAIVPQASSSQPTAVPTAVEPPSASQSVKDSLVFVMAGEPGSIDPWDPRCNATLLTAVCNEIVNEPLTWITSDTFQVVG